ncbi:MAG: NUDIX hydrolase [Clostridiales bacterium]|nr:NUDIX hydrolase [Clostridiales bacterium]
MDFARDKNGKTEAEFLREYDASLYFCPSVTVDAVLYRVISADTLRVLLIRRGGHPYLGKYAFPGGFVDKDESCENAVLRELHEETGIAGLRLSQLVTVSTPDRDPRCRNITVVYCAEADNDLPVCAGDDAADAKWFTVKVCGGTLEFVADGESFDCKLEVAHDGFGQIDINNTKIVDRGGTAFDHAKIICYLYNVLTRRNQL